MTIEKPYLLFAGHHYYPEGGMDDFKGKFETEEEAFEAVNTHNKTSGYGDRWDWHHVTDIRILLEDNNGLAVR
ncbi:hypothetical protein [Stenotrophomonas phage RAS14]